MVVSPVAPPHRMLSPRAVAVIGGSVAVVTTVVLGLLIAFRDDELAALDTSWMAEIVENRVPFGVSVAEVLAFVGGGWFATFVVPLAGAAAFLIARRWWAAIVFVVGCAVSAGIVQLLKVVFGRARPEEILTPLSDFSFPSGHTANAATIATLLVLLIARWWVLIPGVLWVVVMALSRTYLGAHWLTDTVGGAVLGVGVAVLAWAVFAAPLRAQRRRLTARTTPASP